MRKAFSLIEIIIVLIIIGLLISAARIFFTVPAKHILASEQCVSTIHGEVIKSLLQATTGKSKTVTVGGITSKSTPADYSIVFRYTGTGYLINFGLLSGDGVSFISSKIFDLSTGTNNVEGCISNQHRVMMTGSAIGSGLRVDIKKNLIPTIQKSAMTICAVDSGNNCLPNSSTITGAISYNICKRNPNGSIQSPCTIFFSELIDTRTQNIINKRCLSLPLDKACSKRSTDEF